MTEDQSKQVQSAVYAVKQARKKKSDKSTAHAKASRELHIADVELGMAERHLFGLVSDLSEPVTF